MKRKACFLALALVLTFLLTSCGSSTGESADGASKDSSASSYGGVMESQYEDGDESGWNSAEDSVSEAETIESASAVSGGSSVYRDENAKLIRNASLYLQTTEFDATTDALNQLVSQYNGYFETAQVDSGSYYYSSSSYSRTGYYVIRIPSEDYDAFKNQAGSLAHISSQNESTTDIGEEYYDAELHLKTLRVKQERLLALLEEAELMEDIISLESALSDVEYEISQYDSTLTQYDSLVNYATFYINVEEVSRITTNPDETATLGERVSLAFSNGISGFAAGLADCVVWVSYNFIGIIIFITFVAAGTIIGCKVYRKKFKNHNQ